MNNLLLEHAKFLADQLRRAQHVLGVENVGWHEFASGRLDHDNLALAVQHRRGLAAALQRIDQRFQHILFRDRGPRDDGCNNGPLEFVGARLHGFIRFQAGCVAPVGLIAGVLVSIRCALPFRQPLRELLMARVFKRLRAWSFGLALPASVGSSAASL